MLRWLHSLPRAVRNSFHGPGASAGINIEDKRVYEFSCSQTKSESKKRERSKCDGKKKENTCEYRSNRSWKEDEGPNPEKINFWDLAYGQRTPIELISWCGALAAAVHLSQLHTLHEKCRRKGSVNGCHCILYKVIHALPGIVSPSSGSTKRNVLHTSNEKTSNEDIFEFTLQRIEQELLEEIERKTKGCAAYKKRLLQPKTPLTPTAADWTKTIQTSKAEVTEFDAPLPQKIITDKSLLQDLSKNWLESEKENSLSQTSSQKLDDVDSIKENITTQTFRDTIHWLPNGFSMPQPSLTADVLPNFDELKSRQEVNVKPRETCSNKPEAQNEKPKEFETLEEVFEDFNSICNEYTAAGKGMMGLQAAMAGDMKRAVELWKESSKLGNAKSSYNLAMCYETGQGVKKSRKKAVKYYRLAADANHTQALYNLGLLFVEGSQTTPADYTEGLQMLHRAADLNLTEAQRYLGVYYTDEEHEDQEKAISYFRLAANQNDTESQYFLGLCYENGYAVEENTHKAAEYYKLAADKGHQEAQNSLDTFYLQGLAGKQTGKQKSSRTRKISPSASSPSFDDLNRDIVFHGDQSSQGTSSEDLSQLFRDCFSPNGIKPSLSTGDLLMGGNKTADSSVVFRLGCDEAAEAGDSMERSSSCIDTVDVGSELMGKVCREHSSYRRNYTMPDLHVVSCF